MQIPGIGRINKKLSTCIGDLKKAGFEKYIFSNQFKNNLKKKLLGPSGVSIELVTFTNPRNFTDFILSILSFISSAGFPARWTIYADDEFSAAQKDILRMFEFVVYKDWHAEVKKTDRDKFGDKWQFKKYLSFSSHQIITTTIFLDSDVLFYKQFNKYMDYVKQANWYSPEPVDAFSIDAAILTRSEYKSNMFIINSGFMILNQMPPWQTGVAYLEECLALDSLTHFSEQSAVNIVYANDPGARILEPRVFHVSTVDHFKLSYVKTSDLAMRHYVGPVRFKMWQSGWKQFI